MALNAAEEETIEALKTWWDDNGTMLIAVVAAAGLIWAGWTFWQNSRQASIGAASDLYEQILSLAAVEAGAPIPDTDRTRVIQLAEQLQADHNGSVYAAYGALFASQQAVQLGDLETAQAHLEWVLANTGGGLFSQPDQGLVLTANLRLGQVLLARGEFEQALAVVESVDPGAFEAAFAELRGDIYLAQGRTVDARDAYTTAQQAGATSQFLSMKLAELADET